MDRADNSVRNTFYDLDGVGNRGEVIGTPYPGTYVGLCTLVGDLCDGSADQDMNQ